MVNVGAYNDLRIDREVAIGLYLDDGKDGILLPKRFVPANIKVGENIRVFIYHDGEDRLIATTQKPFGIVGDMVKLRAVNVTPHGAFLDNGLMKDLFVPTSKQLLKMRPNGEYLVKIYLDEKTGRMAATEKIESFLSNEHLTVKELEEVDLIAYRRTDLGYVCIINHVHTGLLHFNEIFASISTGTKMKGFIKKIYPLDPHSSEYKIDVVAGKKGYAKVSDEAARILTLLEENNGYLPFHDKSEPEAIYEFFGMSKKTFKMTTGNLYKEKKISFEKTGIKLIE